MSVTRSAGAMLLGPKQDMEDIAEAIRKVQSASAQLVKTSAQK